MRPGLRLLVLVLLLVPLGRGLVGAATDAGTESALNLGAGAKAVAMGGAGLVLVDTANSLLWNPANLAFAPAMTITVQHALLFGDTNHDTVAFNYPTLDYGGGGIAFRRMETGGLERRDAFNLPAGSFGLMEQEATLGYAYPFLPYLAGGLSVKIHDLRLDGLESMAPGMDLGVLFNYPGYTFHASGTNVFRSVRVGLSCRNAVTPVLTLAENHDRLFTNWRAGAGLALSFMPQWQDQLQVAVDVEKPEAAQMRLHVGLDYSLWKMVSLRGGWDQEYVSAGLGVRYQNFTLDYAVSFPEIGLRHLVTLTASLGRSIDDLRANRAADEARKRQAIIDHLKNKMIDDYRQQAMALTEKGNYAAAVPLWEKVLDWEPDNKDVQHRLKLAKEAVMRKQNSESLKLANDYYADQRYIDVMVECRSVLDRDPDNRFAKQLYSRAEKRAKRLGQDASLSNVNQIRNIREAYQKGLQAYTERDWAKAITYWETVIENTPLQKQVYRYLSFARNRLTEAEKAKLKQAKANKTESKQRTLYKEAVNQAKHGDLKNAMKTWEKLVKENPKDADAKKNLDATKKNLIESQKKGIRW